MKCDFSFRHYRECLERAKALGFEFFLFRDFEKSVFSKRVVFLRHDVDRSLANALRFAEIEGDLSINATYFVRVHAPYNPFSLENFRALERIRGMGHEIALHYAPDFHVLVGEEMLAFFRREKCVLESIVGDRVLGISTHEPNNAPFVVKDEMLKALGLRYQAYSPKFVEGAKYISESSGRWREKCMCKFFETERRLCILTHPCWWFDKSPLENY